MAPKFLTVQLHMTATKTILLRTFNKRSGFDSKARISYRTPATTVTFVRNYYRGNELITFMMLQTHLPCKWSCLKTTNVGCEPCSTITATSQRPLINKQLTVSKLLKLSRCISTLSRSSCYRYQHVSCKNSHSALNVYVLYDNYNIPWLIFPTEEYYFICEVTCELLHVTLYSFIVGL
jgi:hypothetical protein